MAEAIIEHVEYLFYRYGSRPFEGRSLTLLEHALQGAHLAEHAGADDALVTAALLLDLGELLSLDANETNHARAALASIGAEDRDDGRGDDRRAARALPLLRESFGNAVVEPILLQDDAGRYLAAVDAGYLGKLSPAARSRLQARGGPFDAGQCEAFATLAGASRALLLRRWDDAAQVSGIMTPSLEHFRERARRCALVPA